MKKIIAFAGSNSSNSINRKLLKEVIPMVKEAQVEHLDLRDYEAAMFSVDLEGTEGHPASMLNLANKMMQADGFLVSVPEHNGSFPAFFKNTFDWLSRINRKVFNNKPTVFLSATPGGRAGGSVLKHIEFIMPHQGAELIGVHGVGRFHSKIENGKLENEEDLAAITKLIDALEKAL